MYSIQYVVTYSKGLISKLFKFFSLGLGSLLYVTEDSLIHFYHHFMLFLSSWLQQWVHFNVGVGGDYSWQSASSGSQRNYNVWYSNIHVTALFFNLEDHPRSQSASSSFRNHGIANTNTREGLPVTNISVAIIKIILHIWQICSARVTIQISISEWLKTTNSHCQQHWITVPGKSTSNNAHDQFMQVSIKY